MKNEIRELFDEVLKEYLIYSKLVMTERLGGEQLRVAEKQLDETAEAWKRKLEEILK